MSQWSDLPIEAFSHLKVIPEPKLYSEDQDELYASCVEKRKQMVSHVKLTSNGTLELLCKQLNDFTALKSMHIQVFGSRKLKECIEMATGNIALPSLKKITIKTSSVEKIGESASLKAVKPMRNVTHVELEGFLTTYIFNDVFLLYIMKKFPNLTTFRIAIDEVFQFDEKDKRDKRYSRSPTRSVDVVVQFLNYVSKIHSHTVKEF